MLAPVVDTCQKPGCRMRLRPRIAGRRGPSGLRNKRSEPESTRCKDCLAPVYGLSRIRLTLHSIAAFSKGHSRDSDGFEPPEGPDPSLSRLCPLENAAMECSVSRIRDS